MTDTYRIRSEETWAEARADYLNGFTAEAVCRRHDLGLRALRWRARRDGWRRADQIDPDPMDDDLSVFEDIEADDLADMARLRMAAAVSRGQATEALRWRRIHLAFQAEADELADWIAADEAEIAAMLAAQRNADRPADLETKSAQPILHELHPDFSDAPIARPLSRQARRHLERQAEKRS